ncbi:uncharacterized protein LOC143039743 isoform X2 [Oratosquilla oratoria]|uniref:uncharacterized protein LOC143039743 isoform X2 n=1 Tax=Oratosquilla oratoria TaxID=337810 RepID=UPI003F75E17A
MPPKRRSNLSRVSKEARRARARRAVKFKKYQKMPWKSAKTRALRKRERRAEETEDEARARRDADAARKRRSRAANNSKALSRREADAARKRRLRAAKDDSKTLSRRESDAARKRRSRAAEDQSQILSRREADAANHRRARSLETPDQRHASQAKLQRMQIKQATSLEQETEEHCDIIEEDIHNGRQHCRWETFCQHQSRLEEMHTSEDDAPATIVQDTELFTSQSAKEHHKLEHESPMIKAEKLSFSNYEKSKDLPPSPRPSSVFIVESQDASCIFPQDIEDISDGVKELRKLKIENLKSKSENLCLSSYEELKESVSPPSQNSAFINNSCSRLSTETEISQDYSVVVKEEFESWHEEYIEDCSDQFVLKEAHLNNQSSAKEKDGELVDYNIIEKYVETLESLFPVMSRKEIIAALRDVDWNFGLATKNIDDHFKKLKAEKLKEERRKRQQELEIARKRRLEKKEKKRLIKEEQRRSEKEIAVAQLRALRDIKKPPPNSKAATRMRKRRAAETPEEAARRRAASAERMRRVRAAESEAQLQARRLDDALRKRRARAAESDAQVKARRLDDAIRKKRVRGLEPDSPTLTEKEKQFDFTKRRKLEERGEKSQGEEGKQILEKEQAMAQLEVLNFAMEKTQSHQEDSEVLVLTTKTKDVNERHSTKSDKGNSKKISTCQSLRSFRMKRGWQKGTVGYDNVKPFPVVYIKEEVGDGGSDQL